MKETPEQRSRTMRAVRSRDTGPEMRVRRALHAAGLRYRLHDAALPGKPDLVFSSRHVALFVHGCFWHQHGGCKAATRPQSHLDYWTRKLNRNVERDARQRAELEALGWTVKIIWECETRSPAAVSTLAADIEAMPTDRRHRR